MRIVPPKSRARNPGPPGLAGAASHGSIPSVRKDFTRSIRALNLGAQEVRALEEAMELYGEAEANLRWFKESPQGCTDRERAEIVRRWTQERDAAEVIIAKFEDSTSKPVRELIRGSKRGMKIAASKMNPDDEPEKEETWLTGHGLRNWVILGVVLAGGYLLYRKYWAAISSAVAVPLATPKLPAPSAVTPGATFVSANKVAMTSSQTYIPKRRKGYDYARILITRTDRGYPVYEFVPSASGWFTGNLVKEATFTWAEISKTKL